MTTAATDVVRQHLIDPEICIRCNTCEETCPIDAITHDERNYVVNPGKCDNCNVCIAPCPTGAIDSWRHVAKVEMYSIGAAQVGFAAAAARPRGRARCERAPPGGRAHRRGGVGRTGRRLAAAVVGRASLRQPLPGREARRRDRQRQFPADRRRRVLRHPSHRAGLRAGGVPRARGSDDRHPAAGYRRAGARTIPASIRSQPAQGERPRYNNLALTVKRVTADREGHPVRGDASNFLCDLEKGATVEVVGPYGTTFLMPNHPGASLLMVCTGTGSAPMRAMTARRRRRIPLKEGGT
jgi:benzoyl-CoA 2,3-dioxygenase component A